MAPQDFDSARKPSTQSDILTARMEFPVNDSGDIAIAVHPSELAKEIWALLLNVPRELHVGRGPGQWIAVVTMRPTGPKSGSWSTIADQVASAARSPSLEFASHHADGCGYVVSWQPAGTAETRHTAGQITNGELPVLTIRKGPGALDDKVSSKLLATNVARRDWSLLTARGLTERPWEAWRDLATGWVKPESAGSSHLTLPQLVPNALERSSFLRYGLMREVYWRLLDLGITAFDVSPDAELIDEHDYLPIRRLNLQLALEEQSRVRREKCAAIIASALEVGIDFCRRTKQNAWKLLKAKDALQGWRNECLQLDTILGHDRGMESSSKADDSPTTPLPHAVTLDSGARVHALVERLNAALSTSDIPSIESALTDAQRSTPADSAAFVRDVNLLLDVLGVRIKTDDGQLGRLSVDRNGVICITRVSGGNRGFKNSGITLVQVSRVHAGNRYSAPLSDREP